MPMISLPGDLVGEALEREATAAIHAILCEPAVRAVAAKARELKRRELRPPMPPPTPEATREFLADGYRRLDIGETAKALADQQHPTAGVLAMVALGYADPEFGGHRFDHTADPSTLREATGRVERDLILAAHVAAFLLIVGPIDPARATLAAALRAYRRLRPRDFNGNTEAYPRRLWDAYEPAAPLALAHAIGLLGLRSWNPIEVLVGSDAIAVALLAVDAQRPARRLFGDRDVFWRTPPALTARFAIRLRIPDDQALAESVHAGEADPVAVLSGRRARCERCEVQSTEAADAANVASKLRARRGCR